MLGSCDNMLPIVEGGLTRRPGTYHTANAVSTAERLIPFVSSAAQSYVIEASPGVFRFYYDEAQIQVSGSPLEVSTPFTADDLDGLNWTQDSDVMYLLTRSRGQKIHKLSRFSHSSWTLEEIDPDDGPFLDENTDKTHTITTAFSSASDYEVGDVVSFTASEATFEPGHVGSLIRIRLTSADGVDYWSPGTTLSGVQTTVYGENFYYAESGTETRTSPPVHLEGSVYDGIRGVKWRYLHSGFGVARITSYTSPTQVSGVIVREFPASLNAAAAYKWSIGAWSAANLYPGVGLLADQRLIAASTDNQPTTVYGSKALRNYEKFEPGARASDAFVYTLANLEATPVSWMATVNALLLGTDRGVFVMSGDTYDDPIDATTARARLAVNEGCAPVSPLVIGPKVVFVSRDRRRLLEMGYDFQINGFQTRDLTILNNEIGLTQ